MLNRNVHIFKESVVCAKLLDKLVCNLVGIAIKKSDPGNIGRLGNGTYKTCKAIFTVKVKAISGGILSDKVNLLYPLLIKCLCFLDDVLNATASVLAADKGNGRSEEVV